MNKSLAHLYAYFIYNQLKPFSLCSQITVGLHKMLVRIANMEDPDQTASSDLGLYC